MAIKVLHARFARDPVLAERFVDEARIAARIDHPGIIDIYDVDRLPDGRPYIIMEYLWGETLTTRLRRGPMGIAEAKGTIGLIASAVGAAHEHGIIHRDLKPENVFLIPDHEMLDGQAIKVLDFGIARILDRTQRLTAARSTFGTPAYMSPEQCVDTGEVDHRTDLYAMGCMFYELLCGKPPFGKGGPKLFYDHMHESPQRPREHDPAIPPDVDDIIMRLLEKDPAQRVQSCAELRDLLA